MATINGNEIFFGVSEKGKDNQPTAAIVCVDGADIILGATPPMIYAQEDNDDYKLSSTLNIYAANNGLLVAAVMHRNADINIDGDGWTKVYTSEHYDGTNLNQWVSVWAKPITSGTYSATFTQAENARMSAKLLCLYGKSNISLVDDVAIEAFPYTLSVPTSYNRLYLLHNAYAFSDGTKYVDIKAANVLTAYENRFTAWYDYTPEDKQQLEMFTNADEYISGRAAVLTFDIS